MIRNLIRYAALAAVVGLGACEKQLAVENETSGDTKRVLGTPNDAEALISTYYKRWHSGLYGSIGDVQGMMNIMSMMNYSSLANNCQNARAPFANVANSNLPGNVCAGEQYRLYAVMGEVQRVASNLLTQMDDPTAPLRLGTTAAATDVRNLRARAFAEFLRGLSIGYTAMVYDSGAVIAPGMTTQDPGTLVHYTVERDSALAAFQRAIDYTNATLAASATGNNGFPIPVTWLPTAAPLTQQEFIRLIRSYRARITTNMARTPTERAALPWASIIADAQNGITADHNLITSTTTGPINDWRNTYDDTNAGGTWHQMPPFFIGMGDVSGSYAAWIAQPVTERGAGGVGFFMVTPDQRFPQGATRALQNADFPTTQCATAATPCKRYYVNRSSGADSFSGSGWGWSNYSFYRYHSWVRAGDGGSARNGATPFFLLAELDLIQAEGLFRTGDKVGAAALVNKTRTAAFNVFARGGALPSIGAADVNHSIASDPNCVPRVPAAPAYNTLECGGLWEALKYEKRIETAYSAYSNWFFDHRGWGDLAKDTPLFWAVPYQDLQARGPTGRALYGAGPGGLAAGNAENSTAGPSNYGW